MVMSHNQCGLTTSAISERAAHSSTDHQLVSLPRPKLSPDGLATMRAATWKRAATRTVARASGRASSCVPTVGAAGKPTLYQLSYSRAPHWLAGSPNATRALCSVRRVL